MSVKRRGWGWRLRVLGSVGPGVVGHHHLAGCEERGGHGEKSMGVSGEGGSNGEYLL